jgi:hypothetical protein
MRRAGRTPSSGRLRRPTNLLTGLEIGRAPCDFGGVHYHDRLGYMVFHLCRNRPQVTPVTTVPRIISSTALIEAMRILDGLHHEYLLGRPRETATECATFMAVLRTAPASEGLESEHSRDRW